MNMKPVCERCGASTPWEGQAFVCSYECTFCLDCAGQLSFVCPNCGGELVERPKRQPADETASPKVLISAMHNAFNEHA